MLSKNDAEQIKLTGADGAAVDTNISVTGIVDGDIITSIVDATDGTNYDASAFTVTEDDVIQSATVDTDTKVLLVMWIDRDAG